jgi:predicted GNAT superfamily acetyltransferase
MTDARTATAPDGVTLRPLASAEDFAACVELQRDTWGREFSDAVPASVRKIAQKVGGVTAGAFAADGRLLGFVFGLTGIQGGRLVHWSHMLAVAPAARDLGLGTRLKLFQRELLLPLGVAEVQWTFDPLEARNAHLNLNRLGAEVAEYVEDMYAGEMGSDLAKGIGTDRFIVAWRIGGERVARRLAGDASHIPDDAAPFHEAPLANPRVEEAADAARELPDAQVVRVEIPANVQAVKAERPDLAALWRAVTRRAFETYLGRGYLVAGFYRDATTGRCFYGLAAPGS